MMNVNQLPNEWINTVNHLIKNSKSNAYAVFNASGELLFANESMHHFLNTNHELKPRNTFINPQFDELIKLTSDSHLIFEGLLTIGNYLDQSFVLNAKVFKQNNTFLVFGEADVFHLFEENRKMSTLNQQVNNLQRQLIKEKKSLQKLTNQLIDNKNNLEKIVDSRTAELARAKDKAEESDRLKSAFISNMSHEIRTPMNAIIGFSDLLKGSINDPILNKYLSSVQSNAKTLLGLISDILELSEIEAGQAEVNTEAVDTKLFFGDIIGIYKNNFEEAKLENKLNIDADFPASIIIDSAKVRQIITNLLSNALKFTHEGYVNLLIAQNKSNQQVHFIDLVITIEDSGIGIPKEHQQTLFHSFSQLDDQSTRKYEGMGLGLSICKKLCSLMNGNITVNSKEGEGTRISLTLPDIEIAKTNEAEAYCSIKRNNIRFEHGRILLIDNVKSNQEYIYALLENTPIKIDIVNNIDGAQECIKLNKYQLVISDIKIHYGVKQINHIIAQLREKNIPIIGISNISKEELKKAELLEFSSLLTYPINADTFYHELSKYLNHSIIPSTSNKQEDKSFKNSILKPQEKQELLALLNGSLMLMWKEFELVQSIKKVHLFSSELSKVAEKFNYSPLQSFAHKLIVSVNSFDIIEIKKNLKLYPQLILDITKTD